MGRGGPFGAVRCDRSVPWWTRSQCPTTRPYVLQHCESINGFYGASSMERLPTEQALKAQTEAFKAVTF